MPLLLHGGTVVDGDQMRVADVLVEDDSIVEVAPRIEVSGHDTIDCRGRFVMPGFVDAHSHADGMLFDDDVQRALLKQGVTTIIAGQDGISYAPGNGLYASEYFATINGPHPSYTGGGVASYLDGVTGTSRLNAAYLVPAGTVRWEVCGRAEGPASDRERQQMVALVEQGMAEGAVGLSTGLDYVPGRFATTDEILELCRPVGRAGGVYVSHMRGGYEANSALGIDEIAFICAMTQTPAHVSHFHAESHIVLGQLDSLSDAGVDATFDLYPYTRGCSLLSMPLLPPELARRSTDEVVRVITDPDERDRLRRDWFPRVDDNASLGPAWPRMITMSHVASRDFAWTLGLTLDDAAWRAGTDPIELSLDILAATRLEANIVMAVPYDRPVSELAQLFAHPGHMAGSDGIFVGDHPHPRARGTFARFLREYVRDTGTWTWQDAAAHLSSAAVDRFGLGARGRIARGRIADLVVVDPEVVTDTASYDEPLGEAVGIDDVVVAGTPVLRGGALTDDTPGQGVRRAEKKGAGSCHRA